MTYPSNLFTFTLSLGLFSLTFAVKAAYPVDPSNDIEWGWGGLNTVSVIEDKFNLARDTDSSVSVFLSLPTQSEWDSKSDDEKALWLINQERIDRGILPLQDIETEVDTIAQNYAQLLMDTNTFGHFEDGSPSDRLNANATISDCHDTLSVIENLSIFWGNWNLPIERAIYNWMYDDSSSSWGHRHTLLWDAYDNNSGPDDKEGFLGFGVATGTHQGWSDSTVIVLNVFDPCSTWDYGTSSPTTFNISLISRNTTTGNNKRWSINESSATEQSFYSPDADWHIVGFDDFDGDNHKDLLWRHKTSGNTYLWFMNGNAIIGHGQVSIVDPVWQIVGVGDFDGPEISSSSIFWRNSNDGSNYIWSLNGTQVISHGGLGQVDTAWHIVQITDFDQDGLPDILWQYSDGSLYLWLMNTNRTAKKHNPIISTLTGDLVGVGDFNHDNHTDLLWRDAEGSMQLSLLDVSGENFVVLTEGPIDGTTSPQNGDFNWSVVGIKDFNSDSKSDVLWHHQNTGETAVWLMDGSTIINNSNTPLTLTSDWTLWLD